MQTNDDLAWLADDRITCSSCRRVRAGWCSSLRIPVMADELFRCMQFVPRHDVDDQRTGVQRWPTLTRTIAEVRKLDEEHRERK